MSRPVIAPSASKHGIADDDVMHAHRNPIRHFDLDEGLTMLVGLTGPRSCWRSAWSQADPDPVVVHAMECRERFLAQIEFRARDERGKGQR